MRIMANSGTLKTIFISWQPYCSRSDHMARELGGVSYKVYFGKLGSKYSTIGFKYLLQILKSLWFLFRELPDVVFVMNPPVFACIPVFLYCFLRNKKYIIDMHTGALVDPLWDQVRFLQKFFAKHASFSIVTNEEISEDLRAWGCAYKVIPDVPIKTKKSMGFKKTERIKITYVNTFSKDEPLSNFLSAVEEFKDVDIVVTGKIEASNRHYVKNAPGHIHFPDFLSDEKYHELIRSSDLVVVLTTRDRTMQRGAYEAIYMEVPIITSNWKVLRENFEIGAIFVDNSVEGIREGVLKALNNLDQLSQEAKRLKKLKHKRWDSNLRDITSAIRIVRSN